MKSRRIAVGAVAVVAAGALGFVGCGGGSTTTATDTTAAPATTATDTTATSGTPAGETAVKVDLARGGEFKLVPQVTSAPAGRVAFTVTNDGTMTHEMVVVPEPSGGPKALAKADGTADEAGALGETSDVPPGTTKSFSVDMKAGKYVLLCNLPGHFAGGMYAEFTVT